jgi:hypothetical protein
MAAAAAALTPFEDGVFISYRRADTDEQILPIHRALCERLGSANRVFLDHKTLRSGQDFRPLIEQTISIASCVVFVIGPKWLESLEGQLNQTERDWVRYEAETTLKRLESDESSPVGKPAVFFALVNGAAYPAPQTLSERLKARIGRLLDGQVPFVLDTAGLSKCPKWRELEANVVAAMPLRGQAIKAPGSGDPRWADLVQLFGQLQTENRHFGLTGETWAESRVIADPKGSLSRFERVLSLQRTAHQTFSDGDRRQRLPKIKDCAIQVVGLLLDIGVSRLVANHAEVVCTRNQRPAGFESRGAHVMAHSRMSGHQRTLTLRTGLKKRDADVDLDRTLHTSEDVKPVFPGIDINSTEHWVERVCGTLGPNEDLPELKDFKAIEVESRNRKDLRILRNTSKRWAEDGGGRLTIALHQDEMTPERIQTLRYWFAMLQFEVDVIVRKAGDDAWVDQESELVDAAVSCLIEINQINQIPTT